jgi:hypothetical protein
MANLAIHLVDSQIDPSKIEVRTKEPSGRTASRGFLELNEAGEIVIVFTQDTSEQAAQLLKQEGGE